MGKRLVLAACACAAFAVDFAGDTGVEAKEPKPAQVKVLTWNVYLGADLVPVIAALSQDPTQAPTAVRQVYDDIVKTDFPTRAKKLAEIIAEEDPDVLALQECVLWRTEPVSDVLQGTIAPNAPNVLFDFAKTLRKELKKRHRNYRDVAVTVGSDVEAPYLDDDAIPGDLRLTDRDVILVKKGVKVLATQTGNFEAKLVLPVLGGVTVQRTYTVIDARVRKKDVRIVAAHLESDSEPIRAAQALELVAGPLNTTLPVIVLGDFNSDAALAQPEATYTNLLGGGLTDIWPAAHPGEPGFTWGQQPLLDNPASTHFQRIDLVLTRGGIATIAVDVLGEAVEDRIDGLWPSDHSGVSALLQLP